MFDHLGNFILSDSFLYDPKILLLDSGLGNFTWTSAGDGGDYVTDNNGAAAWSGTGGIRLYTRSTSPAQSDFVQIYKLLSYSADRFVVCHFRVQFVDASKSAELNVMIMHYDGDNAYEPFISLRPADGEVHYQDIETDMIELTDLSMPFVDNSWIHFSLIYDAVDHEYVSCALNGLSESMEGIPVYSESDTSNRMTKLKFTHITSGAAQAKVHLDTIYLGAYNAS